MEENKVIICRLCLKMFQTGYENVDQSIRETLNCLLLWMNLNVTHEPVICTNCKVSLKRCCDFKTEYLLKTNSTYVKTDSIDLNDLKPNIRVTTDISASSINGNDTCTICMELVDRDSSVLLKNEEKDAIRTLEKYFPELFVNITEDSVTCTSCYKSMQIMVGFISSCVAVEEKVKEYCNIEGTNSKGQIELTAMLNFTFKSELKSLDIRGENVIKVEEGYNQLENKGGIEQMYENFVDVKEQELLYIKKEPDIKVEEGDDDRSTSHTEQDTEINIDTPLALPYMCHTCSYQSYFEDSLRQHICHYEDSSEIKVHACKLCLYRSDSKRGMRQHMLTHKSSFEVKMYKCEICAFQTKYRSSLAHHMVTHKSNTETLMHKCEMCDFQTKHKVNIKKHMLRHKSASEVEMFNCDKCLFQSKRKVSLREHMLVHKNASEVTMYKCELCTFQTKEKRYMPKHMLIHKSVDEVTMYKCKICEFQSKYRSTTNKHMLTHQSASERRAFKSTFKCDKCSYQTKDKSNLRAHMLVHKNASEVTTYKCDLCTFETKLKGNLQKHALTHKSITEVAMYKCIMCPFQSKYRGSAKKHVLTHEGTSKERMFKSDPSVSEYILRQSEDTHIDLQI